MDEFRVPGAYSCFQPRMEESLIGLTALLPLGACELAPPRSANGTSSSEELVLAV